MDLNRRDGAPLPDAATLYEEAACGLLLTAADGLILRVNRTFCRWIGRDADDLVGKLKVQELLTMGGRIFHQTHWLPLLEMQGSVSEVKFEVMHGDGHRQPMVMNALRRDHGGRMLHELAVFSAKDRHQYEHELLLARRRAEDLLADAKRSQRELAVAQARLRLALEAAQLFVWDVDPETRRRRYDDDVARLLGHPSPRPVDEAEFAAAVHPHDRDRERDAFAAAIAPGGPDYVCVFRLQGVDGVERTVQASGRAFFDDGDAAPHVVGMLLDITEISRRRGMAEDRAVLAEQMVGIVSHDLRNPLSVIRMSAKLLSMGELGPNQWRALERLNSATDRSARLISDLLDFTQARLGSGLKVGRREIDLHRLVADSVEELAVAFPGLELRHSCSGDDTVVGDADRLVQMVGNLVANAHAYGAESRPVSVTCEIGRDSWEIAVHNDGEPIPAELLPQLFEPMTRGHGATASGRSVGLGLYIVREIARAHGGDVSVSSTAGAGTTFTARFPRYLPA